jgi:hypothetical protein
MRFKRSGTRRRNQVNVGLLRRRSRQAAAAVFLSLGLPFWLLASPISY